MVPLAPVATRCDLARGPARTRASRRGARPPHGKGPHVARARGQRDMVPRARARGLRASARRDGGEDAEAVAGPGARAPVGAAVPRRAQHPAEGRVGAGIRKRAASLLHRQRRQLRLRAADHGPLVLPARGGGRVRAGARRRGRDRRARADRESRPRGRAGGRGERRPTRAQRDRGRGTASPGGGLRNGATGASPRAALRDAGDRDARPTSRSPRCGWAIRHASTCPVRSCASTTLPASG